MHNLTKIIYQWFIYLTIFNIISWTIISIARAETVSKKGCKELQGATLKDWRQSAFSQGCKYGVLGARKDFNSEMIILYCNEVTKVFLGEKPDFERLENKLKEFRLKTKVN